MKRIDPGRIVLALALAAGLLLAWANRGAFEGAALEAWLARAGIWAPLAFAALYAAATVLFLPGSALTIAAGALFGPLAGGFYSLAGATLGAALAFLVARYLAGDWVARRAGGRVRQLLDGVEAEGWRFVAFVRLVRLFPFNLVNYALGLSRIGLVPYVIASALSMIPGALAYAWLGHAGREALTGAEGAVRNGLLALTLLAAVAFLPRLLGRFRAAALITPQMLQALRNEGGIQVIDLRDAADFDGDSGHLPGALSLPLAELAAHIDELVPWRAGGLVLICRTQVRSRQAARLLAGRGYAGLRIVAGGMQAWRAAGYPTVWSAGDGRP